MKRFVTAALAASVVSAGGTMLVAAPAFAAPAPPTLTIKPSVAYNGDSVAITAKCAKPAHFVRVWSVGLGWIKEESPGEEFNIEQYLRWGVKPGKYTIAAVCLNKGGGIGPVTDQELTVKHKTPPVPPPPPKPIPDFKPNVIVKTGFGGMARFVADHHPVG